MERCFYKLHVIADGMEMVHLKTWSPHFSSSDGCQSLGSLHLMGCGDLRATTTTFFTIRHFQAAELQGPALHQSLGDISVPTECRAI